MDSRACAIDSAMRQVRTTPRSRRSTIGIPTFAGLWIDWVGDDLQMNLDVYDRYRCPR